MRELRSFWLRLHNLLGARRAHREIDAELESHIAMHMADGVRAGLSETEARREALIRLGGAEQARQAWRERETLPWLESLARDVRYGLRTLAKHPGVTAIAILSIGLGIGANATVFSMVSRFVLRPAPVGHPETLLTLQTVHKGENCCNPFSWPLYQDVRADTRSFSDVAAYFQLIPASIGGSGEPERVWGQGVTTNFFSVLELPMIAGRGFAGNEDGAQAVVLGERLWRRRFNGDRSIVGKSVLLSSRTFTVVGVAPATFRSIDQFLDAEFWVPLGATAQLVPNLPQQDARDFHWIIAVARMRAGITRAQVRAELDTLAQRLSTSYPATDKDNMFVFEQAGSLPPREREGVLIFLAALSIVVLLVLAIAGANVSNLLFAQAASRQRDIAVCLALGATRRRLLRQMMIESTLLGIAGGMLGLGISYWATGALSAVRLPAPIPLYIGVGVDWRVLIYSFTLSIAVGLLLGFGPAWAASRPVVARAIRGEDVFAGARRRWSVRDVLIVAQIAMSVVLVSVTGLFLRSLESAARIDIGFQPRGLLMLSLDPRVHGYTAERTVVFLDQLRQRAAAIPGVDAAVVTDMPPLNGGNRSDAFVVAGASTKDKPQFNAELYMTTPGYFAAMGIPLVAGRDFTRQDISGPMVALVNQAFAEHLFGSANPIGQHVSGGHWTYEIVGITRNVRSRTLGDDDRPTLYRLVAQSVAEDPSFMGYTLMVHTAGNPAALSEALRRQVYALDPAMAIYNEETMEEHVRTAYFLPRLAAGLFGIFGGIGLTLAAIGLYGVMSYSVTRRTREIGIRIALGAKRGAVEWLVLRQGMVLTLIAIALGWPAAWMVAGLAASFLYGIQPHDAVTFAVVPPLLAAIALAACWIPARRATSVDPMQALRTE